jgi:hypothetical protein
MSGTTWRLIKAIEPKAGHRLVVTWDDAPPLVVSFADEVRRGRIFTPLTDEATFAKVRIGEGRRTIEWPDPHDYDGHPLIDVDAETLLTMALNQRSGNLFHRLLSQFMRSPTGPDTPQNPVAPRQGVA